LINQALSRADAGQRTRLDENYGKRNAEAEAVVKGVFAELDIEGVYKTYEEESYGRLMGLIDGIEEGGVLNREMFVTFMNRIYKRTL
jgi:farnesyl diphosphate synthase